MKKLVILYLISFVFLICGTEKPGLSKQSTKNLIALLSEARESKDLINTIHKNGKLLMAMSLLIQMVDSQEMEEEKITWLFSDLCIKAGWKEWVPIVNVKRVKKRLYLVAVGHAFATQPSSLYIFYDATYKRIATGENGLVYVIDFRLIDNELGVIFNRIPGSTGFHPDFALLKKRKDEWLITWTPEGQKEWIALDGEIKFLKDDLSLIEVKGSSFALQTSELTKNTVFIEGHPGKHRFFIGIWEKRGDIYNRKRKLPTNVPFHDTLWEMTEPSEYSTVFEFLRRLRNKDDERAAELSNETIVKKAKNIGLSEVIDHKGNIIYYNEGLKRSEKTYSSTEILYFFRNTGEQYKATVKPHNRTQYRIVQIDKIN